MSARACQVLARASYRYKSVADEQAALRIRIRGNERTRTSG